MRKLPKHVVDSLAVHGWKSYKHHLSPEQSWAKDGKVVSIYPAQKMPNMFHISVSTPTTNTTRFIHIGELSKIIEGEVNV
jgi:hypothetical protein